MNEIKQLSLQIKSNEWSTPDTVHISGLRKTIMDGVQQGPNGQRQGWSLTPSYGCGERSKLPQRGPAAQRFPIIKVHWVTSPAAF